MNQTLFRRFKTPQMTTQCTVYTGTSLDVSASSWCAPTNEPIKEHVTTKCRLPEVTVRDCGLGLSGTRKLLALEDWPFIRDDISWSGRRRKWQDDGLHFSGKLLKQFQHDFHKDIALEVTLIETLSSLANTVNNCKVKAWPPSWWVLVWMSKCRFILSQTLHCHCIALIIQRLDKREITI